MLTHLQTLYTNLRVGGFQKENKFITDDEAILALTIYCHATEYEIIFT